MKNRTKIIISLCANLLIVILTGSAFAVSAYDNSDNSNQEHVGKVQFDQSPQSNPTDKTQTPNSNTTVAPTDSSVSVSGDLSCQKSSTSSTSESRGNVSKNSSTQINCNTNNGSGSVSVTNKSDQHVGSSNGASVSNDQRTEINVNN